MGRDMEQGAGRGRWGRAGARWAPKLIFCFQRRFLHDARAYYYYQTCDLVSWQTMEAGTRQAPTWGVVMLEGAGLAMGSAHSHPRGTQVRPLLPSPLPPPTPPDSQFLPCCPTLCYQHSIQCDPLKTTATTHSFHSELSQSSSRGPQGCPLCPPLTLPPLGCSHVACAPQAAPSASPPLSLCSGTMSSRRRNPCPDFFFFFLAASGFRCSVQASF